MANEFTEIRAPYPNHKVTSILPKPLFSNARKTEARVTVKRHKNGDKVVYRDSSNRQQLTLRFRLTRMKSIELERFLKVYQGAPMRVDLFDGSQWEAKLAGQSFPRTAEARIGETEVTGGETIDVTLTFSALRLN